MAVVVKLRTWHGRSSPPYTEGAFLLMREKVPALGRGWGPGAGDDGPALVRVQAQGWEPGGDDGEQAPVQAPAQEWELPAGAASRHSLRVLGLARVRGQGLQAGGGGLERVQVRVQALVLEACALRSSLHHRKVREPARGQALGPLAAGAASRRSLLHRRKVREPALGQALESLAAGAASRHSTRVLGLARVRGQGPPGAGGGGLVRVQVQVQALVPGAYALRSSLHRRKVREPALGQEQGQLGQRLQGAQAPQWQPHTCCQPLQSAIQISSRRAQRRSCARKV
jgi:hypothetical protein